MVRATMVAVATASNNGKINDRSLPVSSIIRITVEMGPCVVAARTAAAPSTAKSPGGTPGQSQDQACPSTAPSDAPTVREGVNKPPGAPVRNEGHVLGCGGRGYGLHAPGRSGREAAAARLRAQPGAAQGSRREESPPAVGGLYDRCGGALARAHRP